MKINIEKYIMYLVKSILIVVYTMVVILGACIIGGLAYGSVMETIKYFKPPKVEE